MECFFGRRRTDSGNLTECVNVLIISPNVRVFGVDPPMGYNFACNGRQQHHGGVVHRRRGDAVWVAIRSFLPHRIAQ
jgi:hypothetical protein